MIVHAVKNEQIMNEMATDIFAAQILSKPHSILGLATGSTPIGLYKKLIQKYNDDLLDFSNITSFNLDEYCGLSHDNPQSYHFFMKDNLFNHINIPSENIHIPNGLASDIKKECGYYENSINRTGPIDLQVLGIGLNGHIGFNEPGEYFTDKTHVEKLTQSTVDANKRFFDKESHVPTHAISMGIGTIMRAEKILLLASNNKKEVINHMLSHEINPNCPASILKLHSNVTLIYVV